VSRYAHGADDSRNSRVLPIIRNFLLIAKAAAFVAPANIGKNDVIRHDQRDRK